MRFALLAADLSPDKGTINTASLIMVGAAVILVILGLIGLVIFFSFLRLWVQCLLTGAQISILDLVGMKLRNVDYPMIVRQKIALVQANVKIATRDLEAHYLSRGNVPRPRRRSSPHIRPAWIFPGEQRRRLTWPAATSWMQ